MLARDTAFPKTVLVGTRSGTFIVAQDMIFGGASVAITRMLTEQVGRYWTRFTE